MSLLSLGSTVSIFDTSAVQRAWDKAEGSGFEGLRKVYSKMLETGPQRFVTRPTSHQVLEGVLAACPNFEGVLDDLSGYIELALVGKGQFKVIPILLAGEPGVGKTHFAKSLAKALSVPFSFLSILFAKSTPSKPRSGWVEVNWLIVNQVGRDAQCRFLTKRP